MKNKILDSMKDMLSDGYVISNVMCMFGYFFSLVIKKGCLYNIASNITFIPVCVVYLALLITLFFFSIKRIIIGYSEAYGWKDLFLNNIVFGFIFSLSAIGIMDLIDSMVGTSSYTIFNMLAILLAINPSFKIVALTNDPRLLKDRNILLIIIYSLVMEGILTRITWLNIHPINIYRYTTGIYIISTAITSIIFSISRVRKHNKYLDNKAGKKRVLVTNLFILTIGFIFFISWIMIPIY